MAANNTIVEYGHRLQPRFVHKSEDGKAGIRSDRRLLEVMIV